MPGSVLQGLPPVAPQRVPWRRGLAGGLAQMGELAMNVSTRSSRRGRALILAATLAVAPAASVALVSAPASAHNPDCTSISDIGQYLACEANRPVHNTQHTVEDEVNAAVDGAMWLLFTAVPVLIECVTHGPNCA